MLIHTPDIKQTILEQLEDTNNSICIISAFVKVDSLRFIEEHLLESVKQKFLLVRFRKEDVVSGSTDFEIGSFCRENGWELYFHTELHSKIYVYDYDRAMVGSANLTSAGIGLDRGANIESVVMLSIGQNEIASINKLFSLSRKIDESLLNTMSEQLPGYTATIPVSSSDTSWSEDIWSPSKHEFLWTSQMIFSASPHDICEHDKTLLNLTNLYSIGEIRTQFMGSMVYKWLKTTVVQDMFFGELTVRLHESLLDDPKPYRRDVKRLLADLLNWITELDIDEFQIDRPRYSQRIRPTVQLKNDLYPGKTFDF